MTEIRPTLMAAVPRLYEKIYARVLESAMGGGPIKRNIFFWAKRTGEECIDLLQARKRIPGGLRFGWALADRLVFSKLRARTGGRLRFFVSGGAPLAADIARFFHAARLPIYEGYGLTETSPVICVNSVEHLKLGTVGRPIPGVEVSIAPDGEILTRGPHLMKGYYQKPEATREAIDAAGWFHTGDVGDLDVEGFLRITDRKKDLIVTAGGKNIAPQPIENLAKGSKYVSNAVMLGDRRPFPIMLIVPQPDPLKAWCARHGVPEDQLERMLAVAQVQAKLEREVRRTLRDLAQFEMPKKFLFLSRDFSVEGGELTPTLKVRRRIVEERHRAAIEGLYEERAGERTDGRREEPTRPE
jgi:long-chain acyl-CoA synthetase